MSNQRNEELVRFYSLLDRLNDKIGGARRLAECSSLMIWPKRGVYFFQEDGDAQFLDTLDQMISTLGPPA